MLTNACPATSNPLECSALYSGLLTRGLFAATTTFANLYTELVQGRGLAAGNFTVVQVGVRVTPPLCPPCRLCWPPVIAVSGSDVNSFCCYGLVSSLPAGFLVVFEKPNRSSFTCACRVFVPTHT
jgi:hypothetical protein